ncbi:hypothetical protein K438DRAFT_1753035 [Mycena galopus ATCC 62051]|nr:hypothetical protein K438DRAFT_1753035 [Mycena galopus ATCC 62051]
MVQEGEITTERMDGVKLGLETFPTVTFRTSTEETRETQTDDAKPPLPSTSTAQSPAISPTAGLGTSQVSLNPQEKTLASSSAAPEQRAEASAGTAANTIPAGIGRETCPICIVDFEPDDILRILPCSGAHRFHQSCVDPWLLELSTACPLCRHDFIALENMISGGSEAEDPDSTTHRTSRLRRFSRYLRFSRNRDQDGDATRVSTEAGGTRLQRPNRTLVSYMKLHSCNVIQGSVSGAMRDSENENQTCWEVQNEKLGRTFLPKKKLAQSLTKVWPKRPRLKRYIGSGGWEHHQNYDAGHGRVWS